ncbi:IclR family transcriptional regulator [Serratia oryzae]|uniref:HTH-type transcriptional repressor AllR n=1 Tax=Serratia oryzae TaxID=2034155 RepID=A0A1S8CKE1_9GAMM|nr:IclR family transcriptional regulator [Serratia oryzae]OMQ23810.1 hypothetical protein BMI79_09935 [Serratia oryzae]VXD08648.1 conserved hypothetical protein [Enterobacterales bacterium 8AC]
MKELSVRALERGLKILSLFNSTQQHFSLKEICDATGLSDSTASRLLMTLVAQGFLYKDSNKKYTLGIQLIKLMESQDSKTDLRHIVYPFLENMRDMFNETASLYIPASNNKRVCTESVQSWQALRRTVETGEILPMTQGAIGYVLLAWQPYPIRQEILAEHTEISAEQLATIRQEGFAINDGIHEHGVLAIAAPIFNNHGQCIAGIALSGPSARLGRTAITELIRVVKSNSYAISKLLGFRAYPVSPA